MWRTTMMILLPLAHAMRIAIVGSHTKIGRTAAHRCHAHGWETVLISPGNKDLLFAKGLFKPEAFATIFVDRTAVTPRGMAQLYDHYPNTTFQLLNTCEDAVVDVDRIFGQLL